MKNEKSRKKKLKYSEQLLTNRYLCTNLKFEKKMGFLMSYMQSVIDKQTIEDAWA